MLNLTQQEKLVIIFLLAMALLGLGIKSVRSVKAPVGIEVLPSDYLIWEEKNIDQLLREARIVNINQASAEELKSLPGIGPVLSQRIIEYRQKHGLFQGPEELKKIPGITRCRFEEFQEFVVVE